MSQGGNKEEEEEILESLIQVMKRLPFRCTTGPIQQYCSAVCLSHKTMDEMAIA